MFVVDASAIIDLILNRGPAERLRTRLFEAGQTLHAPHLLGAEVLHVIRRHALAGQIDARRTAEAIEDYLDITIELYPHEFLFHEAWQLRDNFTAYDAMYVALAHELKAPLITCDERMAKACRQVGVRAELVT